MGQDWNILHPVLRHIRNGDRTGKSLIVPLDQSRKSLLFSISVVLDVDEIRKQSRSIEPKHPIGDCWIIVSNGATAAQRIDDLCTDQLSRQQGRPRNTTPPPSLSDVIESAETTLVHSLSVIKW